MEIKLPESYQWPRTRDENLHESPRALLPVRARRDVRYADQSAKEIDRVEIFAYVTALDGTFHQGTHRFPDLIVGSPENPLGISDQCI